MRHQVVRGKHGKADVGQARGLARGNRKERRILAALERNQESKSRRDATLSSGDRKRLGAHYTPRDLADKVVHLALEPLMVWPHAVQCIECAASVCLLNLLVIDPACGDGVFLESAADVISEALFKAYQREGIDCDQSECKRRVIKSCLIGVDIDPGAIEATRKRLGNSLELVNADALVDWHFHTGGRPTAFIGNPPFIGGQKISSLLGKSYQQRLLEEFPSCNGGADLCTYFLLLAESVISEGKSCGSISFICTNTISQGRTREAGLGFLLQQRGAVIYAAEKDMKWPGKAKVTVSIVHIAEKRLAWRLWPEQLIERALTFPNAWPIDEAVPTAQGPVSMGSEGSAEESHR